MRNLFKMEGICNKTIVNFFTEKTSDDKKNWWNSLDLHPEKEIFLFDSFSFEGFKEFILQDNQKVFNKILYGIKNFNKKGNKITLITLSFL